ncbi:hypothetical protein FQZ97_671590 [compost metagenome]
MREVAKPGVLDQVARGAQLKSMQHLRFVFDRGDHHHLDSRPASFDEFDQVEPRAVAQVEVHQQHVERMQGDLAARLAHTARLGNQGDPVIGQQLLRHHMAHQWVVVHQQNPRRLFRLPHQKVRPDRGRVVAHRKGVACGAGGGSRTSLRRRIECAEDLHECPLGCCWPGQVISRVGRYKIFWLRHQQAKGHCFRVLLSSLEGRI